MVVRKTSMEEIKAKGRRGRRPPVSAECLSPSDAPPPVKLRNRSYPQPSELDHLLGSVKDSMLFGALNAAERSELLSHMHKVPARTGEVVIEEGDKEAEFFFIIGKGTLEVHLRSSAHNPVKVLGAGESFGELALLHNCPRLATVRAAADSELWAMDRATFRQRLALALLDRECARAQ